MIEAFWRPDEAAELDVGWERILFYWRELQPTGPDDWNTLHVLEEWLDEADHQERTVVGLLKNTAPWASEDGTEAGIPKGLYLPVDDPDNLWANFVRQTAEYYSERNVHHWIIWNEPEIKADVFGYEYAGSVTDYYQLVKVAYKVMKEVDPNAVIHLAGLTWWHDQTYLERLLDVAAEDPEGPENDYFFDVISLHIYFRPESIRPVMNAVKEIQEKHGLAKPVWINETNAPPNQDPLWRVDRPNFDVDLEQQAWFIIQAYALGFASGAERIAVYKLIDIHLPPGGESYGLLRPDLSRRPAFDAYKVVTQYLSGFTRTRLETRAGYYVATFEQPDRLTRVLWTRTEKQQFARIPANSTRAIIVQATGETDVIRAEDGFYRLTLDEARCDDECLMGGPPLILVEEIVRIYTAREARIPQYAGPTPEEPTMRALDINSDLTKPDSTRALTPTMTSTTDVPPTVTAKVPEMLTATPTATVQIIAATTAVGVDASSSGVTIPQDIKNPESSPNLAGIAFIMAGFVVATGLFFYLRHNKQR